MIDPTRKRRWPRFTLRTMFVVVAVSAIPMAWLAWNMRQVHERHRMLNLLRLRGAVFVSADNEGELPAFWSRLGAHPMAFIIIPEGACTEAELQEAKTVCPDGTFRFESPTNWIFSDPQFK